MKKFNTGLYVGKFVAYHKGHQNCINTFSKLCDNLKVVLCTKPSDRIVGPIRKKWLENDLISNVNYDIIHPNKINLFHLVEDNIPLYPIGLVEWCNAISNLVGDKIDVMFGNEDYVIDCAKVFNCEYLVPDMERTHINVSSTKILDSKLKYYDYISKVGQPHFNKVVSIVGAENTGKTTLIKELSEKLGGIYIEEHGRNYFENEIIKSGVHGLNNWTIEQFENECVYFDNLIKEKLKKPIKLLFIDNSALLNESYSNMYLRQSTKLMKQLINKQQFDVIDKTIFLSNKYEYNDNINTVHYSNKFKKSTIVSENVDQSNESNNSDKKNINLNKKVDSTFINDYLKYSLDFYNVNYKEFDLTQGYESRNQNIINYLKEEYLI